MNVYDYSNLEKCFVIGSVGENIDLFINNVLYRNLEDLSKLKLATHPKEAERKERIRKQQENSEGVMMPHTMRRKKKQKVFVETNLTNSVIIVNGSNCFGTKDCKYYHNKFKILNNVLKSNDSHLLFVRGNDDPTYFDNELINMSNIRTLKDNSVIKLKEYNCLCIGGGISIDRIWRIEQEKRIGKKLYWENECIRFNEEDIAEILSNHKISLVVSSASPSFIGIDQMSIPWVKEDKNLLNELKEEQSIMDTIHKMMVDANNIPLLWTYGKLNDNKQNTTHSITFNSLCNSLCNIQIFNADMFIKRMLKRQDNEKVKDTSKLGKITLSDDLNISMDYSGEPTITTASTILNYSDFGWEVMQAPNMPDIPITDLVALPQEPINVFDDESQEELLNALREELRGINRIRYGNTTNE